MSALLVATSIVTVAKAATDSYMMYIGGWLVTVGMLAFAVAICLMISDHVARLGRS